MSELEDLRARVKRLEWCEKLVIEPVWWIEWADASEIPAKAVRDAIEPLRYGPFTRLEALETLRAMLSNAAGRELGTPIIARIVIGQETWGEHT